MHMPMSDDYQRIELVNGTARRRCAVFMEPAPLYPIIKIELMIMFAHHNSGQYRCCTRFRI
ncbi:MAG: hypothetical protein GY807_14745 [Gammaproteobacteria bacterium]|nr:hypothetical protein [Gammaproteobacteria bacterium]